MVSHRKKMLHSKHLPSFCAPMVSTSVWHIPVSTCHTLHIPTLNRHYANAALSIKWQCSLLLQFIVERWAKFLTGCSSINLRKGFVVVIAWFWVWKWLDLLEYFLQKSGRFANFTPILSTLLYFKKIMMSSTTVIHEL